MSATTTLTKPDTVLSLAEQLGLVESIERAISYSPQKLAALWSVPCSFNYRLRNSAGYARYGRDAKLSIEFHPGLASATAQEFRDTFLHELAHVMQYLEYRLMDHGHTWWEAMIRLGAEPWETRYHKIDACRRPAKRPGIEDVVIDF